MNESKKRHGCVSAWLWMAIISNLFYVIYNVVSIFDADTSFKSFGFGLLSIFATLNILGTILLMRWNKLGFIIFLVSSILATIVNLVVLDLEPYTMVSCIFAILFWFAILQFRKNGTSAWSLMENGWDYKHCRHLYQLFGFIIGILFVLTIIVVIGGRDDSQIDDGLPYDSVELVADSVAVEEDEVVWQTFSDSSNACSIEVPDGFHNAELNDIQILGLMCTDYDPAVLVIKETANSLRSAGIRTTKDYAEAIVDMNSKLDGVSGFVKIREEVFGDDSYLIVYNLSISDTQFRYYILASRTISNFYYCQVYCLEEYVENLQPTISHMLSSFKVLK